MYYRDSGKFEETSEGLILKSKENNFYVIPSDKYMLREKCHILKDAMHNTLASEYEKIVIDMSEVKKIDAGGINTLVSLKKKAESLNIEIELKNVNSEYVKRVFEIIEANKIF
ncbi:MAG: STAS domain-containing protein [bacterium]